MDVSYAEHEQADESESEPQHNDHNEHEDETEPESVATLHNEESYAESGTEELSEAAFDEARQRQLERLLRLEAEAEQERHIQLNRLAELEAEAEEEREAGESETKNTNQSKLLIYSFNSIVCNFRFV